MEPFKGLGLDGFQPLCFKHYCEVAANDIWQLVGNAFASGRIDQTLAEILIVLIPNVDIDWTTLIILGQLVSVHSL